MKNLLPLIIIIICIGCKRTNTSDEDKDYFVRKTDSSEHLLYSKILVNKYNISKICILLFWDNGHVMSRGFFKGKLREGRNENFYINGRLQTSELYKNGIKEGLQKRYYFNGNLESQENYKDGELILIENFDSLGNKKK